MGRRVGTSRPFRHLRHFWYRREPVPEHSVALPAAKPSSAHKNKGLSNPTASLQSGALWDALVSLAGAREPRKHFRSRGHCVNCENGALLAAADRSSVVLLVEESSYRCSSSSNSRIDGSNLDDIFLGKFCKAVRQCSEEKNKENELKITPWMLSK